MLKLIVGAKETAYPGWISTDADNLDIRNREDWQRRFAPGSIDRIVCEHVLEHLSSDDALRALNNFAEFLAPGGRVRIAVPDAFNPDPYYQEMCRPGGPGQWFYPLCSAISRDEPPHLEHWNVNTLSDAMLRAGLRPEPLEFFDSAGGFHAQKFCECDGPIRRRLGSGYNSVFEFVFGYANLSLIVDGVKSG